MKNVLLFLSFVSISSIANFNFAFAARNGMAFPQSPDQQITPGSTCKDGDARRYPEQIPYCNRNVDRGLKQAIIQEYDQKLGYSIQAMDRQEFKIDHLIPLCAGGSNSRDNLWPQHQSVYQVTDPMEPLICDKMKTGRLRQADAIKLVREAKLDLRKVEATLRYLESL